MPITVTVSFFFNVLSDFLLNYVGTRVLERHSPLPNQWQGNEPVTNIILSIRHSRWRVVPIHRSTYDLISAHIYTQSAI